MKCPKCDYEWDARVTEPKSCPRCKHRLDAPHKASHKESE